ncbi:2-oxoglutarate dehydrogenase complex dihydrolipoyllysine-residue succinyltransferase [Rhizobium sp. WW22]|jgi:2-oxoglutarate dehydrogenase E2 component (dihydrolipoamide succinyltransferase)|uniref:Dihydrolipoyllysine-residue succinyltransferase component of 2-oxoglutarate dehydrogenase complex n=1 Tax=Rhizobium miluonense TaxID=411945 RepID=A0ABU1SQA4_9HYPH|nr:MULTISPECIES: 2-oxoglutarate dehydrogenase complex dihydrolipoyllysine-residue succinyltransferase [Rhizobium]MBB3385850.1 2-oxoglutarate dehydrogenase E2 component (dihydrolipoamide succinyltransferase) [Rhizobium sp. BK098]MBB3617555.1 2-oxoglutarate dehydrogenase E2 component (dihydrolipoamide succinyltransferase) [Rhizobium sp. BK609]MBB3683182.1 2-oxoglutarate dehydrogenase E2 component (dihydrolipoamide succinyltransferase) [Rhizobium sp. BK612]MDR6901109.1 2-oxoglutarate dehydrogenase
MATEIRVPTLGESVSEATVGTWFKKVGDAIKADEPLLELETDKVTIEVPAPSAGTLSEIVAQAGETVGLGALLGQISAGNGAAAAPAQAAAPAAAAPAPAAAAPVAAPAVSAPASSMPPAPAAGKLLAENNLSADQVEGSGKRGQVLKGDVIAAVAKAASAPAAAPAAPVAARAPTAVEDVSREERVKMTRLRQTIAKRLKDAQNTAAMLTTYNEVDMKAVMDLRNKYKDIFEKKHGVKLGFMGFFTKAVTHALKELPAVNAEIDGTDIIYKNYCHVGMAVGTDKGLVVPVIRDADQMSIAEVEKELGRLAKAARDGTLAMADMQGGTFTITNGGVYGSLMSSPILNAPQSGILGMHKIQERPVAIGGQVVIRPMMYLALSYDHRIVDGKEAVTFLVRVKESLEDPERLVLDL